MILKEIKEEIKEYFKDNPYFKSLNSYDYTYISSIRIFLLEKSTYNNFLNFIKSKNYFKSISEREGKFKHNCKFIIEVNVLK